VTDAPCVRRFLVLTAAVAAVAAAVFPVGGSASRGSVVAADSLEPAVLRDINAVRSHHGLVPLRLSAALSAAAASHSREMALDGFFAHESHDGSSFDKRIARYYSSRGYTSWSIGENLVWASPSLDGSQALHIWMHSPPHRANLLNPTWREVGLGAVHVVAAPGAFRGLEVTLVTADFGVRHY
jgi:uncharacterized protein YkwD